MSTLSPPVAIRLSTIGGTVPIVIGSGLLSRTGALLAEHGLGAPVFIVSTARVWRAHGAELGRAVPTAARPLLIPDGEAHKTLRTVSRLYDRLVEGHADRDAVVVAFGGGIVGDVAGFAAATFLRGLPLVQVPTTLLAQVDSAIGGKVGVNLASAKNLVGAFYHPRLVVMDPAVLRTLPVRELRAGTYEIVKYGVIADAALFERLERDLARAGGAGPDAWLEWIAASVRIKASVVERDEREAGVRQILNFGHTFGHALEAATRYRRFRHGEAIGWGMLAAAAVAVRRGTFPPAALDRLRRLVDRVGPRPRVADLSARTILAAMRHDKKRRAGRLHFVLPRDIGRVEVVDDVRDADAATALRAIGARA